MDETDTCISADLNLVPYCTGRNFMQVFYSSRERVLYQHSLIVTRRGLGGGGGGGRVSELMDGLGCAILALDLAAKNLIFA